MVRDAGGAVRSLLVEGHAGFSDEEHGGDIVCAAVSALVGFLGITVSELMPGLAELEVGDGYFRLVGFESSRHDACFQIVLEGWVRSVRQMEENYLGWVKVEQRTV